MRFGMGFGPNSMTCLLHWLAHTGLSINLPIPHTVVHSSEKTSFADSGIRMHDKKNNFVQSSTKSSHPYIALLLIFMQGENIVTANAL